ncbi:MptD family putative ECF transporter S component [Candidatus Bathyarchaeota archaeon]|nr:MptD family putative ECF transporter S component [Candidatus Bathyarchaeota archaeon]
MKDKPIFSSRDIVLMLVFGCLSSLTTLTTAFISAPLPGLYGLIAIPAGTIFLLIVREIVGKTGAATFTQFVSGLISTMLPGGPPVKWIIVPTWVAGGLVVDAIFYVAERKRNKRLIYALTGLVYNIPGDFILYWSFSVFLGWT